MTVFTNAAKSRACPLALLVIRRGSGCGALSFAQRKLLILLSLFFLGPCARCPLSFSPVSTVVWLECHWIHICPPRLGLYPKTTLKSDARLRDVVQIADANRRFQRRPDMAQGKVKFFNSQRGFGFIQPTDGGPDVFVHISAVERAGMSNLNEGQTLTYDVVSERGKLAASNLSRWRCPSARHHRRTGPAHRGEVRHSGHCYASIRQQKDRRGHAIVAIRISIGLMMGHYFMVECDLTWPIESSPAPKQGGDVA
jgi:cold shock protein